MPFKTNYLDFLPHDQIQIKYFWQISYIDVSLKVTHFEKERERKGLY